MKYVMSYYIENEGMSDCSEDSSLSSDSECEQWTNLGGQNLDSLGIITKKVKIR